MTSPDQSFRTLLKDLVEEVRQLIRLELNLAKAEGAEKLDQFQGGAIALICGLLLAFCGLLILLQAGVAALANVVEPWLAAVIVGGVVILIALALVKAGKRKMKTVTRLPERTVNSLRNDKRMVQDQAR